MVFFGRLSKLFLHHGKAIIFLPFFLLFTFFSFSQEIDTVKVKILRDEANQIRTYSDSILRIADSLEAEIVKLENPIPPVIPPWKLGAKFSSNITQVSLTNWVGGGQNSITLVGTADFMADYKKGNNIYQNLLHLHYGIIRQGQNAAWWKNDDQQQFTANIDKKAFGSWNYSMLIDFKTQFSPGYNYPDDSTLISDFLAPGYALAADGLDFKPNMDFNFLVAPVSLKFTIVNNTMLANAGAFGVAPAVLDEYGNIVTPGRKIRSEIGGYLKLKFKKSINHNLTFENNLELFSNYINKPENIDVVWTTITTIKIFKYFSATLNTHLIYDDDVLVPVDRDRDGIREGQGPRIQFEQMFGFGFSYELN
jgi:hypothetical protein